MISAANIQYEIADRQQAFASGGIGLIQRMVKVLELDKAINRYLNLFKIYLPYSESDHVLNIAYNTVAGGTLLEYLELRRNDEAYLDALATQRIPDLTTAGGFCRRFNFATILQLSLLASGLGASQRDVYLPETSVLVFPQVLKRRFR